MTERAAGRVCLAVREPPFTPSARSEVARVVTPQLVHAHEDYMGEPPLGLATLTAQKRRDKP